MKKEIKWFCLLICLNLFLERIPVKRSITMEEANEKLKSGNTYICQHEATTGSSWSVYVQEGEIPRLVCLEGNVPIDHIDRNNFFFFAHNIFLIQGNIIGKQLVDGEGNIQYFYGEDIEICNKLMQSEELYDSYDIIDVEKWDIVSPIDRGESWRFWASRDYLDIFDFTY